MKLLLQVLLLQMLPPSKPNRAASQLAAHQTIAMVLLAKLHNLLKQKKQKKINFHPHHAKTVKA